MCTKHFKRTLTKQKHHIDYKLYLNSENIMFKIEDLFVNKTYNFSNISLKTNTLNCLSPLAPQGKFVTSSGHSTHQQS